ncbi:DUF3575 domain-containing protein [Parabacteroides faecis]|uniref:DUF3575 domain-containing protein n=1 Tax=Parabacteroides faecis TaxID=1217282 RepID=UPI002166AB9F|nr:DUF3575 domain-containing protein [Parabacteroides faecis]MCS2891987.1 DUF3575 domain-containing protein [Parabacteroides faecis]
MYRTLYLSLLSIIFLLSSVPGLWGQQSALKTNVLYWATTTPNGGSGAGIGTSFLRGLVGRL